MTSLTANQLRQRYIDFFVTRFGHAQIRSSSVIPENDPTVLFTTAGMHPLVPYLMGEPHPSGKRLVDAQKCIRTDDIDEVGDASHCTFFEMMGNWSLGDYFKKEALEMSYEFLTGELGLDPKRLCVTVFRGDADAPKDEESIGHWKTQFAKANMNVTEGVPGEDEPTQEADSARIFAYEKKKNWWGPAGQTGPCGPDTEMFYLVRPDLKHDVKFGPKCHPNCDCGRFVEIWNDVFMQYNKTADGKFEPLKQQNVDTGLGLERVAGILQGKSSIYETEIFARAASAIQEAIKESQKDLEKGTDTAPSLRFGVAEQQTKFYRVILDHLRAATFMIGDPAGLAPSNTDQGYILRRLIRRAVRCGTQLGIQENFTALVADTYIDIYQDAYPELLTNRDRIHKELDREETRFRETLIKGEREFAKQMEPFKILSGGDMWLVTLLQWFNVLKQAFDATDKDIVHITTLLGPKMKDIQMILRGVGEYAGIAESDKPKKLLEVIGDEASHYLQGFLNAVINCTMIFSGKRAFYFYETFGFPKELIKEMLSEHALVLEEPSFDAAFKAHQELSRAGAEQKFSGGLADHSQECTMLHTATHLVHQALRDVLGTHVYQKGSNITRERMRFDFSHSQKMTPEELATVEKMVNDVIAKDLPVHFEILDVDEAKKRGAIGVFDDKYAALGNKVKVYFMGDYSKEVCGGPHVEHTGVLKSFKITREVAVSDGVRRIKAVVGGLQQS